MLFRRLAALLAMGYAVGAGSADAHARWVTVPRMTLAPTSSAVRDARVLLTDYERLHRLGLRVTFSSPVTVTSLLGCWPAVARATPRARSRVRVGTIVTLKLRPVPCGLASPGVTTPLPSATVPNFAGVPVTDALTWVDKHRLYDELHLGPLVAGDASTLLDNYRVAGQSPGAGATLTLGHGTQDPDGLGGSFTPTPLVIDGRQTR